MKLDGCYLFYGDALVEFAADIPKLSSLLTDFFLHCYVYGFMQG